MPHIVISLYFSDHFGADIGGDLVDTFLHLFLALLCLIAWSNFLLSTESSNLTKKLLTLSLRHRSSLTENTDFPCSSWSLSSDDIISGISTFSHFFLSSSAYDSFRNSVHLCVTF